jgi:hypothetical protein
MQIDYSRYDRYSENIFSDDKDTRKKYRIKIINHKKDFLKVPDFSKEHIKEYPSFYIVSKAINEFVKEKFIFAIKETPGVILKSKIPVKYVQGIKRTLPVDSNEPTFLVTMPHLANGKNDLDKQIDLLFREGFGATDKESRVIAKNRLHVFAGVNYCHSLDPKINRAKQAYINDLLQKPAVDNVTLEAFRWEPQWSYIHPKVEKKNSKSKSKEKIKISYLNPTCKKAVPQCTVKRLFRLLQEMDDKKSKIVFKSLMKNKVIPYQGIRERIKDSKFIASFLNTFRANRYNRPCYLLICDDDAVRLRTYKIGLFSQYILLINQHPNLKVATTGYYMADKKNKSVLFMSLANETGRYAAAQVRANSAYPSEVNLLIKIPDGKKMSEKISCIRSGNKANLESIGFLEHLGLMKGDVEGQVIYGMTGPIQTGVSPNVNIPKHLKNVNLTKQSFLQSKNLTSLRSFSQSMLNPLDGFAASVLRSYPTGSGARPVKTSLSEIYKSLDPIEYSKSIEDIWLEASPSISKAILKNYNSKYFEILSDAKTFDELFATQAKNIRKNLNIENKYQKPITNLIKDKSISICKAIENLANTNLFDDDDLNELISIAKNVNEMVIGYLRIQIDKTNYIDNNLFD